MEKFIYTTDSDTANNLIKNGFKLINSSRGIFIFNNDVIGNFEQIDSTKIFRTNMLSF